MRIPKSFLIALLLLTFIQNISAQERSKIVFTPQWQPQAQFAGYYIALEQGYYSQAGLDVTIKHPSATSDIIKILTMGEADIVSAFLIHGMKAQRRGLPIKHFAQMLQHSSLMIVSRKESGIESVEDLGGRKLGIWSSGFDDLIFAMLEERKIDVRIIRILNTVNLFLEGGVDAMTVMHYNEYNTIVNCGVNPEELNTFFMRDLGLNVPEDALYCLESKYKENPEVMEAFAEATLKGWEYAANHKDYAIDLVVRHMKNANLPNNRVHQRWMLERVLEAIDPGEKPVGRGKLSKQDLQLVTSVIN
jgi:NitT/TauT family transport system substrate-binding protein